MYLKLPLCRMGCGYVINIAIPPTVHGKLQYMGLLGDHLHAPSAL